MFDDHITVESPGILPGIVRLNNLRTVHFSRNPKIARFLYEYSYVKEFGEGVDRMFNEMEATGLPAPEYRDNAFMLHVTIRNGAINGAISGAINGVINLTSTEQKVFDLIKTNPQITREILKNTTSLGKGTIDRAIKSLKENGLIKRVGSKKSGFWEVMTKQNENQN